MNDLYESNFPSLESSSIVECGGSKELYHKKNKNEDIIVEERPEVRQVQSLPPHAMPTIPYQADLNYGDLSKGSLVLVDREGSVRSLYRTPEINTIKEFEGRYIAVSHGIGGYYIVKSIVEKSRGVFYVLENIRGISSGVSQSCCPGSEVIWSTTIIRIPINDDLIHNFAVSASTLHVYVVGLNQMWVFSVQHGTLIRNIPLPLESISTRYIPVVAERQRSAYTAGIVREETTFHGIRLPIHTGYIAQFTSQGVLAKFRTLFGDDLHFRGMYFKGLLYITGSFSGQLIFDRRAVLKCSNKTSFILALTEDLEMSWTRFITSSMEDFNVIGDVTANDCDEVFTTCRFRNNLLISDIDSKDVADEIDRDGDGMVIIKLKGKEMTFLTLPVGDSGKNSDYVSIDNDGTNIIIAGFSNVPLTRRSALKHNMFCMAFTNDLFELYSNSMAFVENRNFSRIVAMGEDSFMTGSVYRGTLIVEPFGVQRVSEIIRGFYALFDLTFPRLIGTVTSINGEQADIQFSGYNNSFPNVDVAMNYYIAEDEEKNAILTTNPNGRFFGSSIKDSILLLRGPS